MLGLVGSSKHWNGDESNMSLTPVENVTYIEFKSEMVENIKLNVDQELINIACKDEESATDGATASNGATLFEQ